MAEGTVTWWHGGKGYGFVCPDDGGPDLTVYFTQLRDGLTKLVQGDRVSYELVTTSKGPLVVNVRTAVDHERK
ncbi:hypothetical protein GCM10010174_77730 [Kutzneria viridogrisea]|uniref:CspA family cold shock protein n=1 Tax=Kutzneria viridogrisea TaxID=47990 RepID=A0ABR6BJB0_9PSEU|nr:CspA family cold shock protein [Kutzneria viridogrisea]